MADRNTLHIAPYCSKIADVSIFPPGPKNSTKEFYVKAGTKAFAHSDDDWIKIEQKQAPDYHRLYTVYFDQDGAPYKDGWVPSSIPYQTVGERVHWQCNAFGSAADGNIMSSIHNGYYYGIRVRNADNDGIDVIGFYNQWLRIYGRVINSVFDGTVEEFVRFPNYGAIIKMKKSLTYNIGSSSDTDTINFKDYKMKDEATGTVVSGVVEGNYITYTFNTGASNSRYYFPTLENLNGRNFVNDSNRKEGQAYTLDGYDCDILTGTLYPAVLNRKTPEITITNNPSDSTFTVSWPNDKYGEYAYNAKIGTDTIKRGSTGYWDSSPDTLSFKLNYSDVMSDSYFTVSVTPLHEPIGRRPSTTMIGNTENVGGIWYTTAKTRDTITMYTFPARGTAGTATSTVLITPKQISVVSLAWQSLPTRRITTSTPSSISGVSVTKQYKLSSSSSWSTYTGNYFNVESSTLGTFTYNIKYTYTGTSNRVIERTLDTSVVYSKFPKPSLQGNKTTYNTLNITNNATDDFSSSYGKTDGVSLEIRLNNNLFKSISTPSSTNETLTVQPGAQTITLQYKGKYSAYDSDITTLEFPASTFPIIEQPTLTFSKYNTTSRNLINIDGTPSGTLTVNTSRVFTFNAVSVASIYEVYCNDELLLSLTGTSFTLPEERIPTGDNNIYVKAKLGSGTSVWDSTTDKKYPFTKYEYSTPNISTFSGKSEIGIAAYNDETYYELNFNPITEGRDQYLLKTQGATINLYNFILDKISTKTVGFKVRYFSSNAFKYNYSSTPYTDEYTYEIKKLTKPSDLRFENSILSWVGHANDNVYDVYIRQNGVELKRYSDISENSVYIDLDELSGIEGYNPDFLIEYAVKAKRQIITENPYYLNSDENSITKGVLPQVRNVKRVKTTISWDYQYNPSGYIVYKDGVEWKRTVHPNKSVDLSDLPLGEFVIGVAAYRNAPGYNIPFTSEIVNADKFYIKKIDPPVIEFNGEKTSEVKWQVVNHAEYYKTYLNNNEYSTISVNSEIFTKDTEGIYNITVKCLSDNTDLTSDTIYRTSDASNILIYNVIQLDAPTNLSFHEKDGDLYPYSRVEWYRVENATEYKTNLNGTPSAVEKNYYDINDADIKYQNLFSVLASDKTKTNKSNPRYLDSESVEIKFGKLPTPILILEENTVYWKMYTNPDDETSELIDYEGADYFNIYDTNIIDDEGNEIPIIQTVGNSYILTATDEKTFNIYVRAVSNDPNVVRSELSKPVIYTIYKVKMLNNDLKFELQYNTITNVISWPDKTQFFGADYFVLYINGEYRVSTENNEYDLSNIFEGSGGYYEIYVIAKSFKINFIPSEKSFIFKRFITVSYQYGCRINDRFYRLNLPFMTRTTASEELDTAKFSFYSDLKDEYKAFTPVSILTYLSKNTLGEPAEVFDMLVEKDKVSEVQQGNDCIYLHTITAIELTKKLQHDFLTGLSITQELSVVQSLYTGIADCQIGRDGSYMIPEVPSDNSYNFSWIWSKFWDSVEFSDILNVIGIKNAADFIKKFPGFIKEAFKIITGDYTIKEKTAIIVRFLIGIIGEGLNTIFSTIAPINTARKALARLNYCVYTQAPFQAIMGWSKNRNLSMGTSYKFGDTLRLPYCSGDAYYYVAFQPLEALVEFITDIIEGNDPEFQVVDTQTAYLGKRHYYLIPHSELSQADLYDADIKTLNPVWQATYDNDSEQKYLKLTRNIVSTAGYYDLIYDIDDITVDVDESLAVDSEWNIIRNKKKVKIGAMTTNHTSSDADVNNSKHFRIMYRNIYLGKTSTTTNGLTIIDGIQRAINTANLRIIRGSSISEPKYTLDTKNIPNTIICPQFTFSGNKSLWEILLAMGRTFNGIPRLNKNNVISYDVLSNMIGDENPISITNEKSEISSDMDNYATGFVSDVKNMSISTSDYYPSKDGWTTARSTNVYDTVVASTNMGIVLPQNINYIEELWVKVKNLDPVNIADYVFERTVYNALNGSKEGKGKALYYDRGKPYIYGLCTPSENSEFAATLGLDNKNYVITNILSSENLIGTGLISSLLNDVHSFKYRVKYKPLLDTHIITEQSNLSDMPNNIYINFNQDDRAISDNNFGKSTQVQLARIGNNNIIKGYRTKNRADIHRLGECMIVDDKRYYADVLAITYGNTYYDSNVQYSKSFSKINPRIGISSEYRTYNIPNTDIVDRYITINNYCYISKDKYKDVQQIDMTKLYAGQWNGNVPRVLREIYVNFLGSSTERKTQFYITTLDDNYQAINNYGIICPCSYSILGPSIAYSGSFLDNLSAGVSAHDPIKTTVDILELQKKRIQRDVYYTNSKGELPIIKISLCNPRINQLTSSRKDYEFERDFPEVGYKSNDSQLNGSLFDIKYKIDKDKREKLKFVYQLHFQTYDKNLNLLHKGLTNYLYYNDYDDIKENISQPAWYGFDKSVRLLESVEPSTGTRLGYSIKPFSIEGVGIDNISKEMKYGFTLESVLTKGKYKTVALIWPKTGEIILDYTYGENDDTSKTPELNFNLSCTQIENKEQ